MNDQALEHLLQQRFRLESAPTLAVQTPAKVPIAFTHLQCAIPEHGRARPVPAEASFAFQVLLRPMRCWDIWSNRGRAPLPASGPGSIFLFDLTENPQIDVRDPFDMVRFYISQSSLDSLAYEHDQRRVAGLRVPEFGTHDPVLHGMASALAAKLQHPREVPSMFAEHIALAFYAHVSHAYGGVSLDHRHTGGLTHWQTRRACEVMQSELYANHSIGRLAAECGLSSRHFARAFKQSTGFSPHQWLLRKRIERSRDLLAQTAMDLASIALACGFVDQSHFSRFFSGLEGQSPGKWRRQLGWSPSGRRHPPAEE